VAPRSLSVPGRVRVTARLDRVLDHGGGVRGSLEVVLDERPPGRDVGIVGIDDNVKSRSLSAASRFSISCS